MHAEDSADDAIIAEQLGHHAVTRSQAQTMGRAVQTKLIAPIVDATPLSTQPPPAIVFVSETLPGSPVVAPSHVKRQCQTLCETPELQLAREFVKLSYPVTLPISYGPPVLPTPKGKMVVVAVRAQKQSSAKAFVWVKVLSPPYPKCLELKNGPAKGRDFSLLSSFELFHDDHPFIVLTETKFSIRYIPVWARYSPLQTRVEAHAITLSP
jgi:hypothetical protein